MFSENYSNDASNPVLTNCIAWGNNSAIVNGFRVSSVISYSIVQGGCPGGSSCSNVLNVDPLFISSGNLRLQVNSPAINAGTNTGAPNTDLDGNPRALTAADPADMGAYEVQPPSQTFTKTQMAMDLETLRALSRPLQHLLVT